MKSNAAMSADLPELPEPFKAFIYGADQSHPNDYFSESQLRAYALAARAPLEAELAAWRERFPQYRYRPQDDCIELEKQ